MSNEENNEVNSEKRYKSIVSVLKQMCQKSFGNEPKTFQFHEIVSKTGKNEHDVQRALFILEGHKFVSPLPAGDFTSKNWIVTEIGVKALRTLEETTVLL